LRAPCADLGASRSSRAEGGFLPLGEDQHAVGQRQARIVGAHRPWAPTTRRHVLHIEGSQVEPFGLDAFTAREQNQNMLLSIPDIVDLVGRMEARKHRGFGVSPETAPLVIEALRLYVRMHAGEPAKYKMERWDSNDAHVEEIGRVRASS
jgi:hypothetical protein